MSYIILDRDGVINQDSDAFIKSPEEWLPIPGSLEAIALLNQAGLKVVVITNQSGIARGLFDLATLAAIHSKMQLAVEALGGDIDSIYFCPHGPDDNCACRKPKPGLFHSLAKEKQIDLSGIFSIGDSLRDIQASLAVNASPILVKTGKGSQTNLNHPHLKLPIFDNLYDASLHIISTR